MACTLKWSLLNFKQDNSALKLKPWLLIAGALCSALLCSARREELESLCVCVYVCSSTKPGATVGTGPSSLRHTAGQVEEEGASMEMLLLWRRDAATQSGERGVAVV